jgi:hypothetical protein
MPFGWGKKREPSGSTPTPVVFSSPGSIRSAAAATLGGSAPIVEQALLVHADGPTKFVVTFRRQRVSYSEIAAHCGRDLTDVEADLWISQTLNGIFRGSNARYAGPERRDRAWALLAEFRFLARPANAALVTPQADIERPRSRPGTALKGEAQASNESWRARQRERMGPVPAFPPSLDAREEAAGKALERLHGARAQSATDAALRNSALESFDLESAISGLINLAVRRFDEPAAAAAYLAERDVPALLEQLVGGWLSREPEPFRGVHPALVYAAHLVGRRDLALPMLQHLRGDGGANQVVRFWADHHRALTCLVANAPYRPAFPEAMARRLPWVAAQLGVIEALTTEVDPAPRAAAAREAFERANRDKRRTELAVTSIHPSGVDPVRFDLAMWAIQAPGWSADAQ